MVKYKKTKMNDKKHKKLFLREEIILMFHSEDASWLITGIADFWGSRVSPNPVHLSMSCWLSEILRGQRWFRSVAMLKGKMGLPI